MEKVNFTKEIEREYKKLFGFFKIQDKSIYFDFLFKKFHIHIHAVKTMQYFSGAITIFPIFFSHFFPKVKCFIITDDHVVQVSWKR